jgi:hypothetical protein
MHATPAVDVLQSAQQILDQAGHNQLWNALWRHQQQPSAPSSAKPRGQPMTNGKANLNLQDELAL